MFFQEAHDTVGSYTFYEELWEKEAKVRFFVVRAPSLRRWENNTIIFVAPSSWIDFRVSAIVRPLNSLPVGHLGPPHEYHEVPDEIYFQIHKYPKRSSYMETSVEILEGPFENFTEALNYCQAIKEELNP